MTQMQLLRPISFGIYTLIFLSTATKITSGEKLSPISLSNCFVFQARMASFKLKGSYSMGSAGPGRQSLPFVSLSTTGKTTRQYFGSMERTKLDCTMGLHE